MQGIWLKRTVWGLVLALVLAGAAWFGRPQPVSVDLAAAASGPMEVTVEDEGKTRVRHVYTVSAPLTGKVLRISHPFGDQGVSLHVGDQVKANETVVAVMQPTSPAFIDIRSREELQAVLAAADAAVNLADAEIRRIEAALEFARNDLRRAETLARTDAISAKGLDKAKLDLETNEAALASAKAQRDVRRSERASVAARLIDPANASQQSNPSCCIQLRAPVTGRVLKIVQESEGVVLVGSPLVEVGDPLDLEVVADFLSTDAVRIEPGSAVRIEGWGGRPIQGKVTRVDPAGFMKVSALGIEEQRVRITIDFSDPPEAWSRLGHDYRAIVRITVWKSDAALTVPASAVFRSGEEWSVFAVQNGRAQLTPVKIGQRNNRAVEIKSGLSEGDRVVLHPSDRVANGTRVAQRENH